MHRAHHVLICWMLLWGIQDGGSAARTSFNPEVLTTFAKNVASILSLVLVSELQAAHSNRSAGGHAVPESAEVLSKIRNNRNIENDRYSIDRYIGRLIKTGVPFDIHRNERADYRTYKPYVFSRNNVGQVSDHNSDARGLGIPEENRYFLPKSDIQKTGIPGNAVTRVKRYQTAAFSSYYPRNYYVYTTPDYTDGALSSPARHVPFSGGSGNYASPSFQVLPGFNSHNFDHAFYYPLFYKNPGFPPAIGRNEEEGSDSLLTDDRQPPGSAIGRPDYNAGLFEPAFHGTFYKPTGFYDRPVNASDPPPTQPNNGESNDNSTETPQIGSFPNFPFNKYIPQPSPFYRYNNLLNPPENRGAEQPEVAADNGSEDNSTSAPQQPNGSPSFPPPSAIFSLPGYHSSLFNAHAYNSYYNPVQNGLQQYFHLRNGPQYPYFHPYPSFARFYPIYDLYPPYYAPPANSTTPAPANGSDTENQTEASAPMKTMDAR